MPAAASRAVFLVVAAGLTVTSAAATAPDTAAVEGEGGWVVLVGPNGPEGWTSIPQGWEVVANTYLNAGNIKRLAGSTARAKSGPRAKAKTNAKAKGQPTGKDVIFNGPTGRAPNLVSARSFGDVEAHLEFMVAVGSNSGVKFEGVYEVQIYDSHGVARPTASHCGGIYPRAELLPRYHHIDDGYPPLVNAARPAGEWQTLDVVFRAPRFDASGKKVANARFEKVVLNGTEVQKGLELPSPTGHAWRLKEQPTGPLLLQGDHGPVAFRNVRLKPLGGAPSE